MHRMEKDEGGLAKRLAQQLQPSRPQRFHRPFGMGQKVMHGLRIGVDSLAQPRPGLATCLGQEAQMQGSELLNMPHVPAQVANRSRTGRDTARSSRR